MQAARRTELESQFRIWHRRRIAATVAGDLSLLPKHRWRSLIQRCCDRILPICKGSHVGVGKGEMKYDEMASFSILAGCDGFPDVTKLQTTLKSSQWVSWIMHGYADCHAAKSYFWWKKYWYFWYFLAMGVDWTIGLASVVRCSCDSLRCQTWRCHRWH